MKHLLYGKSSANPLQPPPSRDGGPVLSEVKSREGLDLVWVRKKEKTGRAFLDLGHRPVFPLLWIILGMETGSQTLTNEASVS